MSPEHDQTPSPSDQPPATAVVTGGASGLGAATAKALAARGLLVHAIDLATGWEKAAVEELSPGIIPLTADVTSADQLAAAVGTAAGAGPLRVAVNCAGVAWASRILGRKGVHDLDLFASVVSINLIGSFNLLRLAAEQMATTEPQNADGERGVIINTASVAAFDGQIGQIAYAATPPLEAA